VCEDPCSVHGSRRLSLLAMPLWQARREIISGLWRVGLSSSWEGGASNSCGENTTNSAGRCPDSREYRDQYNNSYHLVIPLHLHEARLHRIVAPVARRGPPTLRTCFARNVEGFSTGASAETPLPSLQKTSIHIPLLGRTAAAAEVVLRKYVDGLAFCRAPS
jgi:hypothetical protein